MEPKELKDPELIEALFTEGDRLPRAHALEIVARGDRMVRLLDDVVSDRYAWSEELPAWWASTHAVYLLGAIGGRRVVPPLMRALRHADAYFSDWVLDLIPSIFGMLGEASANALEAAARDPGELFMVRTAAMEGLAAWAVRDKSASARVFPIITGIFNDTAEPRAVRRGAGVILIDFKREELKEQLTAFAREEQAILDYDPEYPAAFLPEDLKVAFGVPEPETAFYTADWMSFYRPEEIAKRQERWAREDKKLAATHEPADHVAHGTKGTLRDGPCPCGSGKKYRNCCMGKVH